MINHRLSTDLNMEQCNDHIGNRFNLVLIASARARELERNHKKFVNTQNSNVITALQEIEAGLVGVEYLERFRKRR